MLTLFTEFLSNGLIVADFGKNLQALIKSVIGPVFLAIVGVISLTFLMQRQMMQFVIFILIAILVAALIYVPDMIKGLGEGAGKEIKW